MTGLRRRAAAAAVLAVALAGSGCASSDDDAGPEPIVDRIDDAIFAVESYYEAPQDYFEISADLEQVSIVVARPGDDGGLVAEQSFWSLDDGLAEPVELGGADGQTFDTGALEFDPEDVFDQVRSELPEASILDFAITGAPDGAVVYDARVQSSAGGILLVRLGPDGQILGSQDATPGVGD